METFIIQEKLPSLNDYINKLNRNRFAGANFKRDVEELISYYIKEAINDGKLTKHEKPVRLNFEWHEKTKKRDADNVASSKKFILDALVNNGVLIDDSRKYVVGFSDEVITDKKANYVVVEITEIK